MKILLRGRGFTLVEVLIVVIIIAILASLILPRMTIQPEKAVIAEGQNMLGVLRRAQQSYMDATATTAYVTVPDASNAGYITLGINPPVGSKFSFSCTSAGGNSCTGTRGTVGTIRLNDDGTFVCDGNYTNYGGDPTKGCVMAG